MLNIFELTCDELADALARYYGKGRYHAAALCREIFKRGNSSFAGAPEFLRSPSLAVQLARDVRQASCRIIAKQEEDGVIKFASALEDDRIIESVIIPSLGRATLCISSQVGCRMGCRFCATGGMGFARNLSVEEIVWQVHAARFSLNHRIDNVVFMGMGEPLDNFENLVQAVHVISDQRGLDIAQSRITISTAGHADGIRDLAASRLRKIRLAVSLNAANDQLRSDLMPINRRFPLTGLREQLRAFPLAKDGLFFIEYVLLDGINDSHENAREVAAYLDRLPVRVNVIPLNPSPSAPYASPSSENMSRFCGWLSDEGLFVRLRRPRGQGIMAACGQLGASLSKR